MKSVFMGSIRAGNSCFAILLMSLCVFSGSSFDESHFDPGLPEVHETFNLSFFLELYVCTKDRLRNEAICFHLCKSQSGN